MRPQRPRRVRNLVMILEATDEMRCRNVARRVAAVPTLPGVVLPLVQVP
jgi:hypothetical protein